MEFNAHALHKAPIGSFGWVGGMYVRKGRETDKQKVRHETLTLLAHEKHHRATSIPLKTRISLTTLKKIGGDEPINVREMKRLVLIGLFGNNWAGGVTIEKPTMLGEVIVEDVAVDEVLGKTKQKVGQRAVKKPRDPLVNDYMGKRGGKSGKNFIAQRS